MTFAERLEIKAGIEILTKQMTLKFGGLSAEYVARIAGASKQQLDAYLERILTAPTPEAVFAAD